MSKKQIQFIGKTITNKITELLDKGVIPWKMPWNPLRGRHCGFTGKAYRGYNSLITDFIATDRGYTSPFWLTLNQVKKLGGWVEDIKSVGIPVTFWNFKKRAKCKSCAGKGCDQCNNFGYISWKIKPWCKLYWVFNADEVKGLKPEVKAKFYPKPTKKPATFDPIQECEKIWDGYKGRPVLKHDQLESNFYIPAKDEIHLTPKLSFHSPANYYCTLFHEAGHSTGHKSRLERDGITGLNFHGSHEYSKEELVAETIASILSGIAGIEGETLENSASYINSWSRKLKDNPDWFMEACSKAQKGVDHIMGVTYED